MCLGSSVPLLASFLVFVGIYKNIRLCVACLFLAGTLFSFLSGEHVNRFNNRKYIIYFFLLCFVSVCMCVSVCNNLIKNVFLSCAA